MTDKMASDSAVYIPRFISSASGPGRASLLFRGIQNGTVSERALQTLDDRELASVFEIDGKSIACQVIDFYRDEGFQCHLLRSYFDLHLTESVLAYLSDQECAEVGERTISMLMDDGYGFFQHVSEVQRMDVWTAPRLAVRLEFLLSHVSRLYSFGEAVSDSQASLVIPDAPWLDSIERRVMLEGRSFVGRHAFERIRRDVVLERTQSSLEIAILRRLAETEM